MHDAYLMLAVAEGFGESPVAALMAPDVDPVAILADPPGPPDVPPRIAQRLRQPDLAQRAAAITRRTGELGMSILRSATAQAPDHSHTSE